MTLMTLCVSTHRITTNHNDSIMTLSKMTLMTFSIKTLIILTLSILTFSILTLSILTLSILTLSIPTHSMLELCTLALSKLTLHNGILRVGLNGNKRLNRFYCYAGVIILSFVILNVVVAPHKRRLSKPCNHWGRRCHFRRPESFRRRHQPVVVVIKLFSSSLMMRPNKLKCS
jgi:hypothetical protein